MPPSRHQEIVRRVLHLADDVTLEYDDDGWDSRVYLFKRGQAAFNFRRSAQAKLQYERGVRVLDALETIASRC